MKPLIATHNSGTGEPSKGLLSLLVLPFAKTQNKSIVDQYNEGCRYFDFRVKFDGWKLPLAHGLWTSKTDLFDAVYSLKSRKDWHCTVTYEGELDNEFAENEFIEKVMSIFNCAKCDKQLIYIAVKSPWRTIKSCNPDIPFDYGFKPITSDNIRWFLPIPWIWDVFTSRPHTFNEDKYTMVDFL